VLQQEFLEPLGLSQYRVAKDISVPPRRINEIVHGKRAVTADTALRPIWSWVCQGAGEGFSSLTGWAGLWLLGVGGTARAKVQPATVLSG
jgi:hypothetical protein